jgi:HEAT repeat protein
MALAYGILTLGVGPAEGQNRLPKFKSISNVPHNPVITDSRPSGHSTSRALRSRRGHTYYVSPAYYYPTYGYGSYYSRGYSRGTSRYGNNYHYYYGEPCDSESNSSTHNTNYESEANYASYSEIEPAIRESRTAVLEQNTQAVPDNDAQLGRLIDQLLHGQRRERMEASRSLADFTSIRSVAVLMDAVVNDADTTVRKSAAKSLGKIADPLAYEVLMRIVYFDNNPVVRKASEVALEEIKYANDEAVLPESIEYLRMNDGRLKLGDYLETLRFGRADQRERAARRLGDFKGTQTSAALIDSLINDPDEYVRDEAASQLYKLGDRMAIPFIAAAADGDPSRRVHRRARKILRRLASKEKVIATR